MSAPALPQEVFDRVTQAWAVQDYALGERLLADARRQYPDHWHLRTCHAAAIGYCSLFRTARAEFASLIADAPAEKVIHMHGLLGVEWCRIGRHDLAVPLLRVAVAAPAPPAPVFEALGTALDHVRDHAAARAVLDDGLRVYPGHPGMLLARARLERQSGEPQRAEATARAVLASTVASDEAKTIGGHELGHALDAQGRYAEAFAAFMAAKAVRRARLAPLLSVWQDGLRSVRDGILPAAGDFLRWREDAAPLPDFPRKLAMLVGCPRSGTTLLERVLDAHPGVVSASETSVFSNIWSNRLRALAPAELGTRAVWELSTAALAALRDAFAAQMEDSLEQAVGARLLLDKNPSQLRRVPAILRVFPEAGILMALRDPRAIAWSCFTQHLPDNPESAAFNSLETTAEHVAAQLDFWRRLRDRLPQDCWHQARYERMVGDFTAETGQTLRFLGLPWDDRVVEFHANTSPVRSPTYAEAARPVYRHAVEKWRNYEEFLSEPFRVLAPVVAEFGGD
jgi:tetratricopeptide (TPR) repeat protein